MAVNLHIGLENHDSRCAEFRAGGSIPAISFVKSLLAKQGGRERAGPGSRRRRFGFSERDGFAGRCAGTQIRRSFCSRSFRKRPCENRKRPCEKRWEEAARAPRQRRSSGG